MFSLMLCGPVHDVALWDSVNSDCCRLKRHVQVTLCNFVSNGKFHAQLITAVSASCILRNDMEKFGIPKAMLLKIWVFRDVMLCHWMSSS